MIKVIMFIEEIKREYKGHIFVNGERELVTVDKDKESLKSTMEWELNTVLGIDNCDITWLKAKQKGAIK